MYACKQIVTNIDILFGKIMRQFAAGIYPVYNRLVDKHKPLVVSISINFMLNGQMVSVNIVCKENKNKNRNASGFNDLKLQ